jgi:hypothetical protein
MRKLLTLLAAAVLFTPSAVYAQSAGEIIGSAVIQVPSDLFECGQGGSPCGLRNRAYNELDPTDFFGAANPVDGYPRYGRKGRYIGDAQLTGNYPSAMGLFDLNWYSVWDGVTNADRFNHVGYYGAQSQVVTHGELGNNMSQTCLPVVGQTACFLALWSQTGNDLQGFGPAGRVARSGGVSPIPRPTVVYASRSELQFAWEEAAAATVHDGAPHPVLGYKLYFLAVGGDERLGPSETDLWAAEALGDLIDATPGTVIPRTTTSYTLSATDPLLAGFDAATQRVVAVIRMVYAYDVLSTHFSANSFPAVFTNPVDMIRDFEALRLRQRVILSWRTDGQAGIRSFNVLRSGQIDGPYHPVDRHDIEIDGVQGSYVTVDRLTRRAPMRASASSAFYRLEVTTLDGNRHFLDPVEVDISGGRRGQSRP